MGMRGVLAVRTSPNRRDFPVSTSRPLTISPPSNERLDVITSLPFFAVHLMCFAAFFTPLRWIDVAVCVGLYFVRMWAITAGYHRYFSHRAYKTSRVFQFLIALLGTTATQKGVLWWAANHRHHHRYSDQEEDIHSPTLRGFWWSHMGWILSKKYNETRYESIKDFARFPELRWLNTYHLVPPVALAVALFFIGGFSMLVWGFFISTTLLWHGTFTINSLSHVFGSRRYRTTDTSRNNFLLALITCGEGWHNNHHYHQNTANQGWFWWEIDASYYALKALSWARLVWDLRLPTDAVKLAHLRYSDEPKADAQAQVPALAKVKEVQDRVRGAIAAATETLPARSPVTR
jgi:stearoyl-CoA desaturase (Delta-9 desaturase)